MSQSAGPTQPPDVPLGRLTQVDPREVWAHEAHQFTPWLLANGDRLADALGIELELTSREYAVGGFSLDIIGRDITHNKVLIVENQLTDSDHSHLGQLMTYAAGTSAATIVWVAPRFRDEHRQALQWLNEHTDEDTHFFGVEVEVVRIGDSVPAPLFNVVAQPNDWQKAVKAGAASVGSAKGAVYQAFWTKHLERMHAAHPDWTQARSAPAQNWLAIRSGVSGCHASANFTADGRLRHEFYIDRATQEECKALFDHLFAQRETFEARYGRPLEWDRLDHRKASRVADYIDADVMDEDRHGDYLAFLLDAGVRLRAALAQVSVDGS